MDVWVRELLGRVQEEYEYPAHPGVPDTVSEADMKYILKVGDEEDPFDVLKLKKDLTNQLKNDTAEVLKQSCRLGSLCVIRPRVGPGSQWQPPWSSYWRSIRLVLGNQPTQLARVLIFAHPRPREFPAKGQPIGPQNVNGGHTTQCDPGTIVVYRAEESVRVLLHELLHASCSDPQVSQPYIEADCESWAEILQCALASKGDPSAFQTLLQQQVTYAAKQAKRAQEDHGAIGPEQYGWRYIVGRLNVWQDLGIPIPKTTQKSGKSLKLTTCSF